MAVSLLSRAIRSTELRITEVQLSPSALQILGNSRTPIRLIARRPQTETAQDLDRVEALVREAYGLPEHVALCFLEMVRTDASEFDQCLEVDTRLVGKHTVFFGGSPVVGNSIAALLIHVEKTTGMVPHAYFKWKEGNPVANMFRFMFLGEGDAAPITHEVLRRAMPDVKRRPKIHVC